MQDQKVSFLSVGTRILLKDTMDQYVRTLGDYKTHYAPNLNSALRTFSQTNIQVLISEVEFEDGCISRLLQELGGELLDEHVFVVLALEEKSQPLMTLAEELEAHAVLVKPFAAANLKALIERYGAWRAAPKEQWRQLCRQGWQAFAEKRFRDSDVTFKKVTDEFAENPWVQYKAGQYYRQKPELDFAEKCFLQALALKPSFSLAHWGLSALYIQRQEFEKSWIHLRKAMELSPLHPQYHAEMFRWNLFRAIEACRTAQRLDPGFHNMKLNLGKLLCVQKDYVSAVRELDQVLPLLKEEFKTQAQAFSAIAKKLGNITK